VRKAGLAGFVCWLDLFAGWICLLLDLFAGGSFLFPHYCVTVIGDARKGVP
jgi:hypothetical protein